MSKFKVIVFSTLLVFGLGVNCYCQELSPEDQVKGAYLFNFAQFTNWPENIFQGNNDPFIIGIVGKDPFGIFIDELVKGEVKGGHPIQVRRFRSAAEIQSVHLLFLPKDSDVDADQIRKMSSGKPILTISDLEGYARGGGMVELYVDEDRMKFIVNVEEAERNNLQFSSKLLRLAKICCR